MVCASKVVIFFLCLLFVVLHVSGTKNIQEKEDKKEKSGKKLISNVNKTPKLNLRTLTEKILSMESKLTNMETRVAEMDAVQGTLADEPPCPVADTEGYNMAVVTQSCYKVMSSDFMSNWTAAQAQCSSTHPKAHLIAIETRKEQEYIKAKWFNQFGIATISRFWTDGSKLGRDDWFWVTAANPISLGYTNWIPATSHDDDLFNCIAVYANEGYGWGDVACWAPHLVTCEIEL